MVIIGFVLHIVLLPLFVVSGLIVPWPVMAGLLTVWGALLVAALMRRHRPAAVMAAPALALLVWLAVVVVGDGLFGWEP